MEFKAKSLRRRRGTNKWEAVLTHDDPSTGDDVLTYHTVEGKTRKQAESARNDLIVRLEIEGLAVDSDMTVLEFMDQFIEYKDRSRTVEPSTIRGYKVESKMMCQYIGAERVGDLSKASIDNWMSKMSSDGYAPKSVSKCFRLLKQALNYGISQNILRRNP